MEMTQSRMVLIALVCVACLAAPALYAVGEMTITGTVSFSGRTIHADNGVEYVIAPTGDGKFLMEETSRRVTVRGFVEEMNGRNFIHAISYELRE